MPADSAPPVALSVPRGTSRRGRFGRRPASEPRTPPAIIAAARTLAARGVPVKRLAEFFVVPYITAWCWLHPRRKRGA